MSATSSDLKDAARTYREIADRHEAKGRTRLARNFRAHAADCEQRAERLRPMTGPEFAAAHGNDSSTWSSADFETEIILAEIDAHTARPQPTTDYTPAA